MLQLLNPALWLGSYLVGPRSSDSVADAATVAATAPVDLTASDAVMAGYATATGAIAPPVDVTAPGAFMGAAEIPLLHQSLYRSPHQNNLPPPIPSKGQCRSSPCVRRS